MAEHRKAMALDPDSYEVNAPAARCYIGMKRNADAIVCLEKAAAAMENDFWALGMAIQCYEAVGDLDGAKLAARRELERARRSSSPSPTTGSQSAGV
jgi:predicted Zn-dependent protease